MRKAWAFSFLVLGISSLIAQVLLIRELLIAFYGNEFFIGFTLFTWLFWAGLGAWLCGRLNIGTGSLGHGAAIAHLAVALLLPATVALIRIRRAWAGGVPGAVPDFLPAVFDALMFLAPLCLILGAQFVLGVRAWRSKCAGTSKGHAWGRAYAWETLGFVMGGVFFSLVLVVWNEFVVAALLGILNAAAAGAILASWKPRMPALRPVLILVLAVTLAVGVLSGLLNRATCAWRYPGQELIESRNSIHGHLAVTAVGGQYCFHENGLLLGAEDEQMASEGLAHYPLLWHSGPRRVLLIGSGFNGALGEILKHRPEQVDYLELDPELIGMAKPYLGPARQAALEDPRVRTVFSDGRAWLHQRAADDSAKRYDVVIVNLPNPGTLLINRFYSREFFHDVRKQLAADGVLAVRLAFSPDYLGPELENLGASIYRALRMEFAFVSILPGHEIFYLATAGPADPPTAADLQERYHQRRLHTDFVIPQAIQHRLTTDRINQVQHAFRANDTAQVNADMQPIACAYNFIYWLRSFHPQLAALAGARGASRWPLAVAAGVFVLGMAGSLRRRNVKRISVWAMGTGSFSLMACELVLLLAFQVFRGYLYYKLALILAALMAGMAAGAILGTRHLPHTRPRTLSILHGLVAVYATGLAFLLPVLGTTAIRHPAAAEAAFLLLTAVIGGLIGFEFPVANRIYLSGAREDPRQDGIVYSVDLIGSCLGALLIGFWALPVLGMELTLVLLAALNVVVAVLAAIVRDPEFFRRDGNRK